MVNKKDQIQKLIVRMLLNGERELSGYDIWKELSMKGVKIKTNYLYMILNEMHVKQALLNARWVDNANGPRKHLYSLSKAGQDEFRAELKESVDLIMAAFIRANLASDNIPEHVDSIKRLFDLLEVPLPSAGARLVLTSPSFDPIICYPISFYALSETFPNASIFVVKPPGTTLYGDTPRNMAFLDGRRHDMPLKDDFADYLMLEGFPIGVPMKETVSECLRVLKSGGHLIIRLPNVMTLEKRPKFSTLAEFASKLFYDFSGQDRMISVEGLNEMLSRHCSRVRQEELRGNVVFYALVAKKNKVLAPLQIPRRRTKIKKEFA